MWGNFLEATVLVGCYGKFAPCNFRGEMARPKVTRSVPNEYDMEELVSDIVNSPSQTKNLECGRAAYLKSGTIVISDPNSPDGGTIYRPNGNWREIGRNLK